MSSETYAQPVPSIDFGRACKWMFASPNWLANLFWVLICALLGAFLIGQIIMIGYQLELFQSRVRGRTEGQADFSFDKIGTYLVRGLIPIAVYFVFVLVLAVVVLVILAGWTLAFSALLGEPEGPEALIFMLPILAVVFLLVTLVPLLLIPLCLRAGLTNNFAEGFNFAWAIDTAKRMWPTMLMCLVYLILLSFLGHVIGIFTCGIGFLFVIPWLQLAITDIGVQAYDIYEAKGGEPIAVEPV